MSAIPPEYAGDVSSESVAAGISIIFNEVFFLSVRALAKFVTKGRIGWDDWLLIPTGAINLAMIGIIIAAVPYGGLGQHETAVWLEEPDKLAMYGQLLVAFSCVYAAAMVFPRLVILNLYLRIFVSRWFRLTTYALMVVMSAYGVAAIIVNLTQCIPLNELWEPENPSAQCINLEAWWTYSSVPNLAIDIIMIPLPIHTIQQLKLPLRDRIGLILTFCSGGAGMMACFARLFLFLYVAGATDDETWADVPLSIISMIEAMTYLVAACLPGLRPLYLYAWRQGQWSVRRSTPASGTVESSWPDSAQAAKQAGRVLCEPSLLAMSDYAPANGVEGRPLGWWRWMSEGATGETEAEAAGRGRRRI